MCMQAFLWFLLASSKLRLAVALQAYCMILGAANQFFRYSENATRAILAIARHITVQPFERQQTTMKQQLGIIASAVVGFIAF